MSVSKVVKKTKGTEVNLPLLKIRGLIVTVEDCGERVNASQRFVWRLYMIVEGKTTCLPQLYESRPENGDTPHQYLMSAWGKVKTLNTMPFIDVSVRLQQYLMAD